VGAAAGVILVVASLLLVLPAEAKSSASMTLAPSAAVARPGQTVTYDLTVSTRGGRTNAVQADLAFPRNLLDCGSVVVDQATWGVTAQNTCANGRLTLAVGSFTLHEGTFHVARVTLKAKAPGTASVAFVPETQVIDVANYKAMPLRTVGTKAIVLRR
jgi:hypothetical protein